MGHFDIWSRWGHLVVMRRSRTDQSEKSLPWRSTLPDPWPSRMTVQFGGSHERSHGGLPDSSLMESN